MVLRSYVRYNDALDEVCFGTCDFLYLRTYFKSRNNVGYVFVTFVDVAGTVAMLGKVLLRHVLLPSSLVCRLILTVLP